MSQIVSGPLPALIGYYQRLETDPGQSVAPYGFSREKIHFQIVLEEDGTLFALEDIRLQNERGKPMPNPMTVPDGGGRSGIALKPFFCWDNTGYVLGRDNKDNPKRAEAMFAASREFHLCMREEVGEDAGFAALCRFLEQWRPEQAESLPNWAEAAGMNVVFRLRGQQGYVHQGDQVKRAWLRRLDAGQDQEATPRGVSLISGQEEHLARLHPLISGVAGTNTTGAAIVSFNLDAFTSYGKSQSYNAPLSVHEAFQYTTALNRLLSDDSHRVRIGDATVVFWTDRPDNTEMEEVLAALFAEEVPKEVSAESGKLIERLRGFLQAARQGKLGDQIKDPEAPFYILALSPNSSRINVRFWLCGTVKQFAERLAEHAERLEIIGGREHDPPLVIRRLMRETAREDKDIAPQLAGELTRAVLAGLPYPQMLFNSIIRRVRADGVVNHRRAAILKACLIRNRKEDVPVALNRDHPDQAYQLGRLFAALEKTQEDASEGKLNSTIKDRYFGAASATPASVFPRLIRLHQYHMDKLDGGMRVNREKLMGEICSHVGGFPAHLSLDKQGLFQIAYYHQRQAFFEKKTVNEKENDSE